MILDTHILKMYLMNANLFDKCSFKFSTKPEFTSTLARSHHQITDN